MSDEDASAAHRLDRVPAGANEGSGETATSTSLPANMRDKSFSVVIPVFNSETIVGETIDRTVAFFKDRDLSYELILVNDCSRDRSWEVVQGKVREHDHLIAIDLLRNYGQHTAVYCGLQASTGDFVMTLDDDMQNPPEEMAHLIVEAGEGHDVVFGRYREKMHEPYRRVGSRFIGLINKHVFRKPEGLFVSNFRIIRRNVVDAICNYRTQQPYITGLTLMFASDPANVWVAHRARPVGKSSYTSLRIAQLVMRILFNYSSFPLRVVTSIGFTVAAFSVVIGVAITLRTLLVGSRVPGWTTIISLTAFLGGVIIVILGMIGEYLVRLINQSSTMAPYHIRRRDESGA
jgi:glycosyltransferase involved in cell wall biosynthesis